jgi:hypothetical protein
MPSNRLPCLLSAWLLWLALPGCPKGWVEESSGVSVDLFGVWSPDGETAFAVGAGGTVLMRSNGAWKALQSGVETDLHGVWGTAADHVVVVGDGGTALQYDGPIEPVDPPPDVPPPDLRALRSTSGGNLRTIDGWAADAAAVGSQGSLQRYDGDSVRDWGGSLREKYGICTPAEGVVFASGPAQFDAQGALTRGGLDVRQDGNWRNHDLSVCPVEPVDGLCPLPPESLDRPILWGAWVGQNGHGAVVGSTGAVWTWPPPAEGAWLPLPTRLTTDLRAVAGRDLQVAEGDDASARFEAFAVGDYGAAMRITGSSLKGEPLPTNQDLLGVWVSEDGAHVYVVGRRGTIYHRYR